MTRSAEISRKTGETDVSLTLGLDGSGAGTRSTGVGFLDHMLDLLARHGRLDLTVNVASCAIDVSGRPYCAYGGLTLPPGDIAGFEHEAAEEFFRAVASAARLTLHLELQAGTNAHHMIEACFKAFARALRVAVAVDPSEPGIPSTKGTLT
jgi:imidazoleglycerol-phosphate dehydratase